MQVSRHGTYNPDRTEAFLKKYGIDKSEYDRLGKELGVKKEPFVLEKEPDENGYITVTPTKKQKDKQNAWLSKRKIYLEGKKIRKEAWKASETHNCHYCRCFMRKDVAPSHPDFATVDHVVPVAMGGAEGRKVLACRFCNLTKGRMSEMEYRLAMRAILEYRIPTMEEYLRQEKNVSSGTLILRRI